MNAGLFPTGTKFRQLEYTILVQTGRVHIRAYREDIPVTGGLVSVFGMWLGAARIQVLLPSSHMS